MHKECGNKQHKSRRTLPLNAPDEQKISSIAKHPHTHAHTYANNHTPTRARRRTNRHAYAQTCADASHRRTHAPTRLHAHARTRNPYTHTHVHAHALIRKLNMGGKIRTHLFCENLVWRGAVNAEDGEW